MNPHPTPGLFARDALLPEGWVRDVAIRFGPEGDIVSVDRGAADAALRVAEGPVIPGGVNVHSHAFQRALVGRVQRLSGRDDFWTWRERMFRLVGSLSPEDIETISLRVYREMLLHGYTSVGEFHYLHRDEAGNAYAAPEELSLRIVSAAAESGIALTLLPVLYRRSGFDGKPLEGPARRFYLGPGEFRAVMEALAARTGFTLGVAPHSLRACSADDLAEIATWTSTGRPVHMHVSEQTAEVEACLSRTGRTPARWLLQNADVNRAWTMIHATHTTPDERVDLASRGVTIGLCPTTEGDLGDGLFPFPEWLDLGGRFAVGSDSQVSVSAGEELRALLYRARIQERRRGVSSPDPRVGHGTALWVAAARDGAAAIGRMAGLIEVGRRADLVVLDENSDLLAGLLPDDAVNAFVLSGSPTNLARVLVGGSTLVEAGRHVSDEAIRRRWAAGAKRISSLLG